VSTATIRTTCRYATTVDTTDETSQSIDVQIGVAENAGYEVPCRAADPDLWFAESPGELEHAKSLCAGCPIRRTCLSAALDRAEPWGVWGGEILDQGVVIARKRPRGRPRKHQQVA
jgi:WhiB family redox-sensing transcriptional regulator